MLAKLTTKNQLTLPKSVVNAVGKTEYFEVEVENGRILLTPVRIQQADAVKYLPTVLLEKPHFKTRIRLAKT